MTGLALDTRLAVRRLRAAPTPTLVVVLTLGVGLAAAATASGVVRALLFRPFAFSTLDRLMLVRDDAPAEGVKQRGPVTPADYRALATEARAFAQLAAFRMRHRTFGGPSEPVEARVVESTANFFAALDARPSAGRLFTMEEESPGRDGVVVLSEPFWRSQLGGRDVLGETVRVDDRPFTVVGILSASQRYPLGADIWIPLALSPDEWQDRRTRSLLLLGLLGAGVGKEEAEADSRRVASIVAQRFPDTHRGRSVRLLPLRAEQYEFTLVLFSLVQAVALGVLLLAGSNALTILAAQCTSDRRQMAIRSALGSGVAGLVRPMAVQTAIVSLVGGGVAVVLSSWAIPAVRRGVPPGIARWIAGWESIGVDWAIVGSTLGTALLGGLVLGAAIAIRMARGNLSEAFKDGAGGAARARWRGDVSVWVQSTVSLVLLALSCFFLLGLRRADAAFDRFESDTTLLARVTLPASRYADDAQVVSFFDRAVHEASTLPGVRLAGLIRNPPASNVPNPVRGIVIDEDALATAAERPVADVQLVSPRTLEGLGVAIERGRGFLDTDVGAHQRVALVNAALAKRVWPGREAIGRTLHLDGDRWVLTVVGVVRDVQWNWFDGTPRPTVFLPPAQAPGRTMFLVLRAAGDATSLSGPLRAAMHRLDPTQPLGEIRTLREEIDDSLAPLRTLGGLLSGLAAMAFFLAVVGIYGVSSTRVANRRRELAVRAALGARPSQLGWSVVARALGAGAIGCAIGGALTVAAVRVAGSRVFALLEMNVVLLAALIAVLCAAAMAAGWFPARHAMRADPVTALRI